MKDFWESMFKKEETTWGFEPSDSAILTNDFFVENNIMDVLIPGIGYGRNAKVFINSGISYQV